MIRSETLVNVHNLILFCAELLHFAADFPQNLLFVLDGVKLSQSQALDIYAFDVCAGASIYFLAKAGSLDYLLHTEVVWEMCNGIVNGKNIQTLVFRVCAVSSLNLFDLAKFIFSYT